jgi:benzil reductase ((S)-benzoin forming)
MPKHLYIITGASRGMGLALAEQLIAPDNRLLCISRKSNPALQKKAADAKVFLEQWQLDLADSVVAAKNLNAWLADFSSTPSPFASATLINNAGVIADIGPLSEADSTDLANAIRVGLEAPLQLCAAFLRGTSEWVCEKKILNISSGLGKRAMASQSAYCAAKAGMDHFTRCLAMDEALKTHGAKVCSLAPGVIDIDMQIQLRATDEAKFPDKAGFVAMKEKGQLSTPEQAAAKLIAYLQRPDFGNNPVADVRDA